jgi:twitching motility protein PilI
MIRPSSLASMTEGTMEKTLRSIDLVDFQKRLNADLESSESMRDTSSLLGFLSGGHHWLVSLEDLHEIESVPLPEKVQRVALAKAWALGISNFKGNIYTLVDFQMFLGHAATTTDLNARALLIHARHQIQAALVVAEVVGLVDVAGMKPLAAEEPMPWVSGRWEQGDGKIWNMIDVAALSAYESMLNIAA